MKNRKKYLLVIMTIIATSCTNWLDVQPTDTVSEDKMFAVAEGHRVALNGIYKLASGRALYGEEMTWGLISALGDDYVLNNTMYMNRYHVYRIAAYEYKYTNAKAIALFDPIWSTAYSCIVNCNNLIGKIKKESPEKFKQGVIEQNMIKGEALAMRAMLHFDILRLYAPAPIKDDGKSYIPYYDQDGLSSGKEHLPVKSVLSKVVRDLKEAQELVAPFDTSRVAMSKDMLAEQFRFTVQYPSYMSAEEKDIFYSCRGYRMNYTAITAMLARVYNYMGEHKLAFDESQKVIAFKTNGGYSAYRFTLDQDVFENRKTTDDLIMTLQSVQLYINFLPHTTGSDEFGYYTLSDNFMSLFTKDDPDYRSKKLIAKGALDANVSLKNYAPAGADNLKISDMIPIIRLSEMYYITAEYYASIDNFSEATKALELVRMGRNCKTGSVVVTDKETFQTELIKEMRREFVGEGQTYFYYKKLGVKVRNSMKDENFIFPKPINENVQI